MKARKIKIIAVIAALLIIVSLWVILSPVLKEKLLLHKKYEKASQIAVGFIRDKYGFDAKVTGIEIEAFLKQYDEPECADNVSVTMLMKYGDKEFKVNTGVYNGVPYCRDDYQADQIIMAAEKYISGLFPDGSITELEIGSPTFDTYKHHYFRCFNEYFSGDDIENYINNCNGSLDIIFADRTFSEKDIENFPDGFDVELISFDTEEHRNDFLDSIYHTYTIDGEEYIISPISISYEDFTAYINDYLANIDGEMIGLDTRFS